MDWVNICTSNGLSASSATRHYLTNAPRHYLTNVPRHYLTNTGVDLLKIGPLRTNVSRFRMKIHYFSFMKIFVVYKWRRGDRQFWIVSTDDEYSMFIVFSKMVDVFSRLVSLQWRQLHHSLRIRLVTFYHTTMTILQTWFSSLFITELARKDI